MRKKLFNGDVDLLLLAFIYCQQQARKTHRVFNICDVLWACETILRKIELKARKGKSLEIN